VFYCPISGLEIYSKPDWINCRCSESFEVSFWIIGKAIIYSKPKGRADLEGVHNSVTLKKEITNYLSLDDQTYIQIQDYSNLKSSSLTGRNHFIMDANADEKLKAMIFCNLSTPFSIAVKMGNRFNTKNKMIYIEKSYRDAIEKASMLSGAHTHTSKDIGINIKDCSDGQSHSFSPIEIISDDKLKIRQPGFSNDAIIINKNIFHSTTSGFLKPEYVPLIDQMRHQYRSKLPENHSFDYIIVNGKNLHGSSQAARFKLMQSLRLWHEKFPFKIYISYNVNKITHAAFRIANTLLPFQVKVVKNLQQAMGLAREDQEKQTSLEDDYSIDSINKKDIEDLLSVIGNLNWEVEGVKDTINVSKNHPFYYLYQSITLIKEEFDELFIEKKQKEEALKESERISRTTIENSPIAMLVYSKTDEKIITINAKFTDLFGYKISDIPNISDWWPLAYSEISYREIIKGIWTEAVKKAISEQAAAKSIEMMIRCKNGTQKEVSVQAASSGNTILITFVDLTELKASERQKKELESRLRQAHKIESLGTIAGGIAHDFNNILSIILGNAQLAIQDLPDWSPALKKIENIETASLNASGIVKQLLNFSRKADDTFQPVNITGVLNDTLKLLRSTIPSSIEVNLNIPETDISIFADPVQIKQILLNICTNASQEMADKGGILRITADTTHLNCGKTKGYPDCKPGHYFKLSISDTGQGIRPEIINRIFDPYFTTKKIGKGTGMGLAVVLGIVKNHGGMITVDSQIGKGSIFKIFLPIIEGSPLKIIEQSHQPPIQGKGETILFVDDEQVITEMSKEMIEGLGYLVYTKTDPIEALNFLKSNYREIDLLITDMTMPKMSGIKLAELIKNIRPDLPIIICTGYSALIDKEKLKRIRIADIMLKPIEQKEIAEKIRKALDE